MGRPIVQKRFERLKENGVIDNIPTWSQALIAGRIQILGTASDETEKYYQSLGINFNRHIFRRVVAQTSTMIDPTGVFSNLDTIINHTLQTMHRFPIFDFGASMAHPNGLQEMKKQIYQAIEGTHPEQRSLSHLHEDASYWYRLAYQIEKFEKNPSMELDEFDFSLDPNPYKSLAMHQFATMRGYTNYASRMNVGFKEVVKEAYELMRDTAASLVYKAHYGKEEGEKKFIEKYGEFRVDPELCDPHIRKQYFPTQSQK